MPNNKTTNTQQSGCPVVSDAERELWGTEKIFRPVDDWSEDDGVALFFRLGAGEPPEVTSPISSDWESDYFTHWMPLPKVLLYSEEYRLACVKSGIATEIC